MISDLHLQEAPTKYEKIKPLIRYINELESYLTQAFLCSPELHPHSRDICPCPVCFACEVGEWVKKVF